MPTPTRRKGAGSKLKPVVRTPAQRRAMQRELGVSNPARPRNETSRQKLKRQSDRKRMLRRGRTAAQASRT